jgi:tRNA U38,U39,U40 pseudouridine synthase TruA
MVRIIVGTLLWLVGINKIKPQDIKDIILAKIELRQENQFPASGLCWKKYFTNTVKKLLDLSI